MLYQIKYKELFNNYCDNFKNKNKIELWEHYSNKYKNGISVNINKIKSVFLKLDKNTLENESIIYIIYNNNKDVITFSILDEIITNF